MATGQLTISARVNSTTRSGLYSVTGESGREVSPTPAAAKAGTVSVKTNASAATLAMTTSGHGFTSGTVADLFWASGMRAGVTVGTLSGATGVPVTADDVGGDELPIATTAIRLAARTEVREAFDGDDLKLISITSDERCYVELQDSSDNKLAGFEVEADGWQGWADGLSTNPVASDSVDHIQVSSGDTDAASPVIQLVVDNA